MPSGNLNHYLNVGQSQLEQLECLHSETPPMIIHISDSHQIPSLKKTRQSPSYKLKKIAQNSNFEILIFTLHATHFLKLLDKMYKYEMDPTTTVDATEWTRDVGGMDGWTESNQYPLNNFVVQVQGVGVGVGVWVWVRVWVWVWVWVGVGLWEVGWCVMMTYGTSNGQWVNHFWYYLDCQANNIQFF